MKDWLEDKMNDNFNQQVDLIEKSLTGDSIRYGIRDFRIC